MTSPIRVLVADDHRVVRDGLRAFLTAEPGIDVVGEAADAVEVVEQVRQLAPDVVIMDLAMPGGGGIAATATIVRANPTVRVVVLTSAMEDSAVPDALKAGATAFVLKDSSGDELVAAVRAAAAGRMHVAGEAAQRLARAVAAPAGADPLTPREAEVIALLAEGMANKEIARRLGIREKTVKGHVTNILQKLHVTSRTQAALHALKTGLAGGPAAT